MTKLSLLNYQSMINLSPVISNANPLSLESALLNTISKAVESKLVHLIILIIFSLYLIAL